MDNPVKQSQTAHFKVNLLDASIEPTDGELETLWSEVLVDVRVRQQLAHAEFFKALYDKCNDVMRQQDQIEHASCAPAR